MPAWPSQSALKAALRQRIAIGLWRRISRAQAAEKIASLVAVLADDAAELVQCRLDVADPGASVRSRRAG